MLRGDGDSDDDDDEEGEEEEGGEGGKDGDGGTESHMASLRLTDHGARASEESWRRRKQGRKGEKGGHRDGEGPSWAVSREPRVYRGLIASGDCFVSSDKQFAEIKRALGLAPRELLCVEMEGAAVCQVAHEYGCPALVIRVVSDAGGDAAHDFSQFISEVAARASRKTIRRLFASSRELIVNFR